MTDVRVVPEGAEPIVTNTEPITDDFDRITAPDPTPPDSPMGALRDRIERARQTRTIELEIPGVDGVVVRFGVMGENRREAIDKRRKNEKAEKLLRISADVLVATCLGVFDRFDDGTLLSIDPDDRHGTAPRFSDPRMAELLGLPEGTDPSYVVTELFVADGDVIQACDRVLRFSGYSRADVGDEIRGNY